MYDIVAAIGLVVFWFILLAPLGQIVVELIDRRTYSDVTLRLDTGQKAEELALTRH